MKRILFFLFLFLYIISCNSPENRKESAGIDEKLKLMDVDRAFSRLSEEKGMKNAFLEYIDSNGILLRPHHLPLIGPDAIDFLIRQNDTTYTLKWEPGNAAIAKSGEMGYTYGIYALEPTNKDTVIYGTYVSIWKKQQDGNWKFVLDCGNEGIKEK